MIAPHILVIAGFLSVTWGVYLLGTVHAYREARRNGLRRRQDIVVAMRRFIVALCLWLFVFSFVFRTGMVLAGVGEDVIGQVVFFALLGTNVVGSIFACVSLKYD